MPTHEPHTEVPQAWRSRPNYSYHAGWISPKGEFFAVPSHSALRVRGYASANRAYQKAERAKRRANGRSWRYPNYSPGTMSNYSHLWSLGYCRLTVKPTRVSAEHSAYDGGGKPDRPALPQVLTEAQAEALARLCRTIGADLEVRWGTSKENKAKTIYHHELSDHERILREVRA